MKTKAPLQTTAIAACAFELQATGAAIQVLPAGAFKARDGRPADVESGHWFLDGQIAARLMAKAATLTTDIVVDYEHQTLNSEKNGEPAPAAGWVKGADLEWREGQGLFATRPEWTDKAAGFIAAREYRYLSPVFTYDTRSGAVLALLHIALTNYPALDGMESLPALAAARFQKADSAAQSVKENQSVNREQLLAVLGLAPEASDEDIQNALSTLKADAGKVSQLEQAVAAAKTATADPAKFVPIQAFEELKGQVVALKADQSAGEVEALVVAGLSDGRLLPAQEEWARELGGSNLAALKSYLVKTPAIAALRGQQTQGKPQTPVTVDEMGAEALAVCTAMGVTPEQYLATLKA